MLVMVRNINLKNQTFLSNMTKERQLQIAEKISDHVMHILNTKGDDYANNDRLSNFKSVASMINSHPLNVCLTMISIKIARIVNLLEKNPHFESLEDSIDDLIVYAYILKMMNEES